MSDKTSLNSITKRFENIRIKNNKINIHNLDILEQKILEKYRPKNIDDMNDRKNRNIADFFLADTPPKLLVGKPINEYKRSLELEDFAIVSNSGGGNNDCLIISVLMGISSVYRKLSYEDKYKFAREFRMEQLVPLIIKDPILLKELKNNVKAYISSSQMLDDSVIPFLARLFKINILQLEKYKSQVIGGQKYEQPPSAALVTNPTFKEDGEYPIGIIIININNAHYEIVRENPNKYIFSYDELNAIYNKINNSPLLQNSQKNVWSVPFDNASPKPHSIPNYTSSTKPTNAPKHSMTLRSSTNTPKPPKRISTPKPPKPVSTPKPITSNNDAIAQLMGTGKSLEKAKELLSLRRTKKRGGRTRRYRKTKKQF